MDLSRYLREFDLGALTRLQTGLSSERCVSCAGLCGSLKAFVLARLFLERKRSVLVVCREGAESERLQGELATLLSEDEALFFPELDTLPFEKAPPHPRIVENRLHTYDVLSEGRPALLVTTFHALLMRLVPPEEYRKRTLLIRRGEEHGLELLAGWLSELGYVRTPQIEDAGQYSVRGGILDVFPLLQEFPLRLEFFGDTVESIRPFEISSQRSIEPVESAKITPLVELYARQTGCDIPAPPGALWQAADYIVSPASLFDYLGPDYLVWFDELSSWKHIYEDYASWLTTAGTAAGVERPLASFLSLADAKARFECGTCVENRAFASGGEDEVNFAAVPQPCFSGSEKEFFITFRKMLEEGYRLFVCCDNKGQKNRLEEMLAAEALPVSVLLGVLEEGFLLPQDKLALFSENGLFNRYRNRIRFRKYKGGTVVKHIAALKPGDIVVHVDHGVGRFLGLERVSVGAVEKDCIKIEYQEGATLSVPVEDLRKVQKYSSTGEEGGAVPVFNRLGGKGWERAKSRAKAEINRVLQELVELYASRRHCQSTAFPVDTTWQKEFEEAFIYTETPDQMRTSDEIKKDLQKSHPMDRLLCGDAGFGKTEVAMRAAFKVVEAGQQVAVLVPTTLLAYQHFRSFSERFRDYPFQIRMISRFIPKKEVEQAVEAAKAGEVDILIGTHRLFSKQVGFKELGLLIIDEEHRFGVKQKERLKALKTQVHVLSMTATPIPRTLQFSLTSIRDLSLLNTPPRNRMPILTRIEEWSVEIVREAVLRERGRGGQVFYVHNRVESIQYEAEKLREALPGCRIAVAHGQMSESELEPVMVRFLEKDLDILLCTAIIESGIDIPNANTIILNHADKFGLSQLYQLRGRVGRSSIQAYAYLLVNDFNRLTDEARQRLKTLEQLTEFGSGFQIAMRDLEIRGAGNMLGVKQHGLLCLVGFEMYQNMIKEAVQEITEKGRVMKSDPEVRFEAKAFLPHDYITESALRLELYQRLSAVDSVDEVEEIGEEMADRFGALPIEVQRLLDVICIKTAASGLHLSGVSVREGLLVLEVDEKNPPLPSFWAEVLPKLPVGVDVQYQTPVLIRIPLSDKENSLRSAKQILLTLA